MSFVKYRVKEVAADFGDDAEGYCGDRWKIF